MARGKRIGYDDPISKDVKEDIKSSIDSSPTEVETLVPETKNGIVVNSLHVNVRKKPSYDSDVIEVLGKGDKVAILGNAGGFYKVSTAKRSVAYVSSDFIKEE